MVTYLFAPSRLAGFVLVLASANGRVDSLFIRFVEGIAAESVAEGVEGVLAQSAPHYKLCA